MITTSTFTEDFPAALDRKIKEYMKYKTDSTLIDIKFSVTAGDYGRLRYHAMVIMNSPD